MGPPCLPGVSAFQLANREGPRDLCWSQTALGEESSPEAGPMRQALPWRPWPWLLQEGSWSPTSLLLQLLPDTTLCQQPSQRSLILISAAVTPSQASNCHSHLPTYPSNPSSAPPKPEGPQSWSVTPLLKILPWLPFALGWGQSSWAWHPCPPDLGLILRLQPCLISLHACWTLAPCSPNPCHTFPLLALFPLFYFVLFLVLGSHFSENFVEILWRGNWSWLSSWKDSVSYYHC